jgi:hypothetical protein
MWAANIPAHLVPESLALTATQFQGPDKVPPELERFANIPNAKTRRAFQLDITDFSACVGTNRPEEFRLISRAHVIAWRRDFERLRLPPSTNRYISADSEEVVSYEEELADAELAQKLYDLRTKAGLTQRPMVKLVGTTASVI